MNEGWKSDSSYTTTIDSIEVEGYHAFLSLNFDIDEYGEYRFSMDFSESRGGNIHQFHFIPQEKKYQDGDFTREDINKDFGHAFREWAKSVRIFFSQYPYIPKAQVKA